MRNIEWKKWLSAILCLSFLLAAAPVSGLLSAADVVWQEGTSGVGQYAGIDQTAYGALGTSLVNGMTPTVKKSVGGSVVNAKNGNGAAATDGTLIHSESGTDCAEYATSFYNQYAYMSFDLGAMYDLNEFVVASIVRADRNTTWNLRWVRVYVSDDASTLFDATNLVARAEKVTDDFGQMQIRPENGTATGQYVGFTFWVPGVDGAWRTANPFDPSKDLYELPNINYNNDGTNLAGKCWGGLLVGEIGVFGQKVSAWQEGTNGIGRYQSIDQAGYAALGTSLIAGMTPTLKSGATMTNVKNLTDGKLSANDEYAEFRNYYNQWGTLKFDLGAKYDIDNLLVGSPVRSDGNKAWNLRWFRVYVSEDGDTLFDDANLVAQADKLSNNYGQVQVQPTGGKATGRYVGFRIWVPSVDATWKNENPFDASKNMYEVPNINYNNDGSALAGQCWGALEIGELGVFGEKTPSNKPNKQTVVCVGDSITYGTYYEAQDTALSNPKRYATAYPAVLETLLDGDENTDYTVVNASIPDASVTDWLSSAESKGYVQSADTVVLMLGSVDAGNHWQTRKANYKQEYKKIIDAFKAKNDDVNILLVTSPYSDGTQYAESLPEMVTMQKELANEPGIRCIDMYTHTRLQTVKNGVGSFLDEADCALGLHLHPHQAGHRMIAEKIFDEWTTETPHRETVIGTQSDLSLLPQGANLIKGEAVDGKNVNYLVPFRPNGTAPEGGKDFEQMVDGLYYGINTNEKNCSVYQDWHSTGVVFDLRGDAQITDLFIYAGGAQHYHTATTEWAIPYLEVYVGDDASTVVSPEKKVATVQLDGAFGKVVQLNESVTGRYVGFYAPGDEKWGNVFLGELGVYGTYTGLVRPLNAPNLLSGMEPVEHYLAKPGDPAAKVTYADVDFGDGDNTTLTDGDESTMTSVCLWANIMPDTIVCDTEAFYLDAGTAQQVIVYYLGGKTSIDTISLTGIAPYTAGVDYYVSEKLATLFDKENLIYTTHGEKTTIDEYGRTIFDPAYDKSLRTHTYDRFDKGEEAAVGRYVAFVLTRPYASTVRGWYYSRITELVATGTLLEKDPVFDTSLLTVKDESTGISATLYRLNNDDVEFFNNLGGLRVTKTAFPKDVNNDTNMHWLTVDSDLYTLELVDKSGRALTEEEVGKRYWIIDIPTKADYFQTMGRVADGELTRIRNAYTIPNAGVVRAGSEYENEAKIYGNGHQLVLMRYNSIEEIDRLNGYSVNDVPDGSVTKGASGTANRLPWISLAAVFVTVLLFGGATFVWIKKSRKGEGAE